ncbi:hypothetical protein YPPY89_2220, partial [Yersinia pestis PY-89]
MSGALA